VNSITGKNQNTSGIPVQAFGITRHSSYYTETLTDNNGAFEVPVKLGDPVEISVANQIVRLNNTTETLGSFIMTENGSIKHIKNR